MGILWWPLSIGIPTLTCSVKRKEHSNSLRSTSSEKNPVKAKPQRSPKHTLISGKAAGVSLVHGMWCWWDCWNFPDITTVNLTLAVWYTMRIHSLWLWRLTVAKIEGWGEEWRGAGGTLSYLKLHSHCHCNSAGILYQSGCSFSWYSGLTMMWEKVNRRNVVLSLQQLKPRAACIAVQSPSWRSNTHNQ